MIASAVAIVRCALGREVADRAWSKARGPVAELVMDAEQRRVQIRDLALSRVSVVFEQEIKMC